LRKANSFLLQTSLKVIDVLTSLECVAHLHIIRRHFGVLVIHDISAIATRLRKEHSRFSHIEIWEGDFNGPPWKYKEFVWNEVFGVFHVTEFVYGVYGPPTPALDPSLYW
jgi:hypothetical protein